MGYIIHWCIWSITDGHILVSYTLSQYIYLQYVREFSVLNAGWQKLVHFSGSTRHEICYDVQISVLVSAVRHTFEPTLHIAGIIHWFVWFISDDGQTLVSWTSMDLQCARFSMKITSKLVSFLAVLPICLVLFAKVEPMLLAHNMSGIYFDTSCIGLFGTPVFTWYTQVFRWKSLHSPVIVAISYCLVGRNRTSMWRGCTSSVIYQASSVVFLYFPMQSFKCERFNKNCTTNSHTYSKHHKHQLLFCSDLVSI